MRTAWPTQYGYPSRDANETTTKAIRVDNTEHVVVKRESTEDLVSDAPCRINLTQRHFTDEMTHLWQHCLPRQQSRRTSNRTSEPSETASKHPVQPSSHKTTWQPKKNSATISSSSSEGVPTSKSHGSQLVGPPTESARRQKDQRTTLLTQCQRSPAAKSGRLRSPRHTVRRRRIMLVFGRANTSLLRDPPMRRKPQGNPSPTPPGL